MSCLSLAFLEQLLVWAVIVFAVVAIIRLIVPWVLSLVGVPVIAQVINIILWAVVAIVVIYIVFALLSCLLSGAHISLLPPQSR